MRIVLHFIRRVAGGGTPETVPAEQVRSIFQDQTMTLVSMLDGREIQVTGERCEIRFEQEVP